MKWYRFYRRYHSCFFRPVGLVILYAGIMILIFRQEKPMSKETNSLRPMQSTVTMGNENDYIIPAILLIITGATLSYRKKTRKYWIG